MFEFHGWLSVWDADYEEASGDRTSAVRPDTLAKVQAVIERMTPVPPTEPAADPGSDVRPFRDQHVDLRLTNGAWLANLSGYRNHRQQWVIDLFHAIGQAAPGSYGELLVHDDESRDHPTAWTRYTMVRGQVRADRPSEL